MKTVGIIGGIAPESTIDCQIPLRHEGEMNELVNARFEAGTRDGLLRVIDRMRQQLGIEGVILGGTELPLILRDVPDQGIPFFDTTKIHVDEIVAELLLDVLS